MLTSLTVFLMQCGFGMLEAGAVRAKNTRNILMKNLLDTSCGCLAFWLFGWSVAFARGNPVIGIPAPYGVFDLPGEWFHHYVYAAASATIVSGAIAERTQTMAYVYFSVATTGFIYPVVVHWAWSEDGFLSTSNPDAVAGGLLDLAGSGVVHLTGGVLALVAAAIIGPRRGRFNEVTGLPVPMPGHSSVLMALGCFTLWFGWLGFNMGSITSIRADPGAAPRVAVATLVSGAAGGMTETFLNLRLGTRSWSVERSINGILAGLVSITASCSVVHSWAALLIGCCGGCIYHGASAAVLYWLKVDDVLDAFAVHGACGLWGLIAAALFATEGFTYGAQAGEAGLFYGGGKLMGAAALAALAISAWAASMGALLFGALHRCGVLRVGTEAELVGVDYGQHGGSAYGLDPTESPVPEYPPPYTEPAPRSIMPACRPHNTHSRPKPVRSISIEIPSEPSEPPTP